MGAVTAGLTRRLGALGKNSRHALLVAEGEGVVNTGVEVSAVDTVAPRLVAGCCDEGVQGGPRQLGRPLLLLGSGQVVECDLGNHGKVTDDTVAL